MRKIIYLVSALASILSLAAEPARKTVVVLGDSIAAGYGLEAEEAFPAILQEKIDKADLSFRVVNAGVSGETTAGGSRRISWLLRQPIDVLLIELGGNDGLRGISPDETEKNLQAIIDKARAKHPNLRIVLAGMQMPASMGEDYNRKYREVFGVVAKRNNAVLVPFLLEGVGGRADLNQADRIHPTAAGQKIVADTIWKYLEPVLKATVRDS